MSLLTEQEVYELGLKYHLLYRDTMEFARAIETKVIERIKAQGPEAWLHRDRSESDVVTTKVKHVWGKAAVGSLALYDIPLYRLPEGD